MRCCATNRRTSLPVKNPNFLYSPSQSPSQLQSPSKRRSLLSGKGLSSTRNRFGSECDIGVCTMRGQQVILVLACTALMGCSDSQKSYTHGPQQFTKDDKWALQSVQKSPLGNLAIMRLVVDDMLAGSGEAVEGKPLNPCQFEVTTTVQTDKWKSSDGKYPESYTVVCFTSVGRSPTLEFVWDVERSRGVVAFRWGWRP